MNTTDTILPQEITATDAAIAHRVLTAVFPWLGPAPMPDEPPEDIFADLQALATELTQRANEATKLVSLLSLSALLREVREGIGLDCNCGDLCLGTCTKAKVDAALNGNPFMPVIEWTKPLTPIGPESDPLVKLLGRVRIGNAEFHAEAYEVFNNDEEEGIQDGKQLGFSQKIGKREASRFAQVANVG